MSRLLTLWLALLTTQAEATERWVTLGAGVTETVFALGEGDHVVAVDASSLYPPAADALPEVGSHRRVDVEAVLAARPTLVLASSGVGPPEAIEQLRAAGVEVLVVAEPTDLPSAMKNVRTLATKLGASARGEALVERLQAQLAAVPTDGPHPRVAFIYARGAGTMMVGGRGTGVQPVVERAGGVLLGAWDGFRPLTAEGLVSESPDVLLFTTRGLESLGGLPGVLALPGVAATPAGRGERVLAVDDLLLLTLGPRTGEAVQQLHAALVASP